jgi:hypothetical protein
MRTRSNHRRKHRVSRALRFVVAPFSPSASLFHLPALPSAFDMYLVVERRRLPAHKAILALRSVALAELIAREEQSARGGDASATVELVRSLLCSESHAFCAPQRRRT